MVSPPVGAQIGVTPAYVADIEAGRRLPSAELKERIAVALEIPLEELAAADSRLTPDLRDWIEERPQLTGLLRSLRTSPESDMLIRRLSRFITRRSKSQVFSDWMHRWTPGHTRRARRSWPGIIIAALSLIVMPLLARAKRKVALGISSRALVADSKQTDICAYLSAILLVGLDLNASLGWWWADPVAGLIMVPIIAKEGLESLRGETCSDCHS